MPPAPRLALGIVSMPRAAGEPLASDWPVLCPRRGAVPVRSGELAGCLAPGGWLVVEELDWFSISALATGVWAETMGWYAKVMRDAGADLEWGRHLPARLAAAGLVDGDAAATVDFFAGGSGWAELMMLTVNQVWDRIERAGAPPDLWRIFTEALADPLQRFPAFAHVAGHGRRVG
jgi:hypothetical protein